MKTVNTVFSFKCNYSLPQRLRKHRALGTLFLNVLVFNCGTFIHGLELILVKAMKMCLEKRGKSCNLVNALNYFLKF